MSAIVHYTYCAEWLPEAGRYVGVCMEFPWLRRDGPTAGDAIAAVQDRVDELVEGMLARDEDPPPALTERHYSGKFVVRTSTALHARLTVEAIEQGVSLNQWVVQKLSGRGPEPTAETRYRRPSPQPRI